MVLLDVDHPDIVEFIRCKAAEEKKAWALIDAGYDGAIDGEAYASVYFQNSNNSVRVSDAFMAAAEAGQPWATRRRTDGAVADTHDAATLMREMAEAAHLCGDPGLQFDTTINAWHTSKATDRIYASNPCSEFIFLNDTACNLASIKPDEVSHRGWWGRCRGPQARRRPDAHSARAHRRQRGLSDLEDHRALARVQTAGLGLCQSRRAADGERPRVRLVEGQGARRRGHRHRLR